MNSDNKRKREIGGNVADFPSKIPGKLVSTKLAHTDKIHLHLVSSTPMNPAKRANFFDESNLFSSPIRSSGSSTDVNTNSPPDNKIKIVKREQNTKKTMLNEEQAVGTSPFPFLTKLSIKKMTICASDEDSDDNIFVKPNIKITKANNKLIVDTSEELNSDSSVDEIISKTTKAIVEPSRKVSINENEDTINKHVKEKLVDVLQTTNVAKTSERNKENIGNDNTETTEMKTKTKIRNAENTKKKQTDNEQKPNLDAKQRKSNENTVQKKRITKNKDENKNNDINRQKAINKIFNKTYNKKLTLTNNDTKIKIAEKTMDNTQCGLRKSARNCQSSGPYWMTPLNATNVTDVLKRTKLEDIGNSIIPVKGFGTKRTKTISETITTKKKKSTKVEEKLENTVVLNKSKTKAKSESGKRNLLEELAEGSANIIAQKTKGNENNSNLIDEIPETTKKLNITKTKYINKKEKESEINILESNKEDTDTLLNQTASNVQGNKRREYSKEKLDKENTEKKNKVENIVAKLKVASPNKTSLNLRDLVHQSILSNDVFEFENQEIDDVSSTLINEENQSLTTINIASVPSVKPTNSKCEDVNESFEVLGPLRTSKRIIEKNKKGSNKIDYTLELTSNSKPNRNDVKSTQKKTVANTKKKIQNEEENIASKSRKLNRYFNEPDLSSNSENSNENDISKPRMKKRRVIEELKPVKKRNKTITPGLNRKHIPEYTTKSSKSSKQVNFNVNNFKMDDTIVSDSLSSYENPSKRSCKATHNFKTNPPRQFNRSRGSRYARRRTFHKPDRNDKRKNKYFVSDSMLDNTDSWSSEEVYMSKAKKHKYQKRNVDNSDLLNFKEKALDVQMPVLTRLRTEYQHQGETLMLECFGHFPEVMKKTHEQSPLRGICFMNDLFGAGVMEITLGTMKSSNSSENHTYFVILDGVAEIGIAGLTKILRIGDCCIVPKHTSYYVANASREVNLLVNYLKIAL